MSDDQEVVIPEKDLREAIDNYFTEMHTTLWGRAFDVVSKDTRANAVTWLAETVEEVMSRCGITVQKTPTNLIEFDIPDA